MPHHPPSEDSYVLNVYKEIPWTSHDTVARVRRILEQRAVGHAGSLDPFASGVLLIAVGRATKLVSYLMELPKSYRGTMLLGRRTASGDMAGATLEERPAPSVDLGTLRETARGFEGEGWQTPPMVSAVKHEGQRLYDLARQGIEVERKPRRVHIQRFDVTSVEGRRVDFELDCGRGTYVRTLVEDLAAKLGTIATVESLTRARIGNFEVAESCRLISPPCSLRTGLMAKAVPMGVALGHLPRVKVDRAWVRRLRNGGLPPWHSLEFQVEPKVGQVVRLLGYHDELLAVARLELLPGPVDLAIEKSMTLKLERVF